MSTPVFAILRDFRAIMVNLIQAMQLLPAPVRAKLQDHIDANQLFLARIEKNLQELVKQNDNT